MARHVHEWLLATVHMRVEQGDGSTDARLPQVADTLEGREGREGREVSPACRRRSLSSAARLAHPQVPIATQNLHLARQVVLSVSER